MGSKPDYINFSYRFRGTGHGHWGKFPSMRNVCSMISILVGEKNSQIKGEAETINVSALYPKGSHETNAKLLILKADCQDCEAVH